MKTAVRQAFINQIAIKGAQNIVPVDFVTECLVSVNVI